jgi:hypothetical protein
LDWGHVEEMESMSVELEQLVAAELEREVVEESSLSHSLGLLLK